MLDGKTPPPPLLSLRKLTMVKHQGLLPQAFSLLDPQRCEDAVFVGWQKVGGKETLPLYNITAPGHPLSGSTVTDMRLLSLNLRIPFTPPRRA
jgi:hypothetical protein